MNSTERMSVAIGLVGLAALGCMVFAREIMCALVWLGNKFRGEK
jgi:hypothetical protein